MFGCLLVYGNRCFIIPSEELIESEVESRFYWHLLEKNYEVLPETVGQFTGLTDKNGVKIFEGDIVRQTFEKTVATAAEFWDSDEYADLYGEDVGAVVMIPSHGVCIKNPIIHREVDGEVTQHGERAKMYKNVCSGRCEVIGNIHDNPELLEVGGDG